MNPYLAGFLISIAASLILVPIVRKICIHKGYVARPRLDRWHQRPTASLGGIAIFLSFLISIFIIFFILNSTYKYQFDFQWNILIGPIIIFLLGLFDDIKELSPPTKLVGQILAASIVVYQGYTTEFFNPRIANNIIAQIPNIVLTFIWIVGITNAINLLDNMDGLAGGISVITAGFLSYFFFIAGNYNLGIISLVLAGSVIGFLVFNFPPAKIFMGDSGSLFLGFTLALLAIARQPQASNVFAVLGVPTFLFLIPIIDTILVLVTRILRGQSPLKGGKDHTSHRLIALGLSERRTLFILYAIAILLGFLAAFLESIRYWFSLVLIPTIVLVLTLLTSFLGGLKIIDETSSDRRDRKFIQTFVAISVRGRLFEVILDFFLIGIAYYLAFLFRYNLRMNDSRLEVFLMSLPIVLVCVYLSYFLFGVYRGVWGYIGMEDYFRYFKAVLSATILTAACSLFFVNNNTYTPLFYFFFCLFLFLGLASSRSSFQILRMLTTHQSKEITEKVLILGARDSGEITVKFIQSKPELKIKIVGFLDGDPSLKGRQIYNFRIYGDLNLLESLIIKENINGIIYSPDTAWEQKTWDEVEQICKRHNCWLKQLCVDLAEVIQNNQNSKSG